MSQLGFAIEIAATFHSGQFDKGGRPYILHPLEVMRLVSEFPGCDDELMCIAVLHDTAEDTDCSLEYLEELGFSERIIDGVDSMTKRDEEDKHQYIARLIKNPDAIRVKMADLRHNSDLRRLKGVTQKDLDRMTWYQQTYERLKRLL